MARFNRQTKQAKIIEKSTGQDKLLPRLTGFFFRKPGFTGMVWIVLLVFGILSYTTFLRREGFPSINIPLAIINGTYATDDPGETYAKIVAPIADIAHKQANVSTVQTQNAGNFFSVVVQYKDGVNGTKATNEIKKEVAASAHIPTSATIKYEVPYFGVTGGSTKPIDLAISFYSKDPSVSTAQLLDKASQAVAAFNAKHVHDVKNFSVNDPFADIVGPGGTPTKVQQTFDRFSYRQDNSFVDANSVLIAVTATKDHDVIKLDNDVRAAIAQLSKDANFDGYGMQVSASYAPSIKDNISELQKVLLEGLLIVLIVGSLIIAVRASLITVLSMATVIALTLGVIYLLGYTLNVITLFALILSLSLIVDDTIIMVEAIDAARRKQQNAKSIIHTAARKVSRAMLAATLTASLSFAPFLFVTGILGSFIRAIPITIITALLTSLLSALIFIPFFSRFTLLTRHQLETRKHNEMAARLESAIARGIARPMLWAQHSRKKLTALGFLAIIIGLGFLMAGGVLSQKVIFNIFPATKDTNDLSLTLNFPNGTTIDQAEALTGKANKLAADQLGSNLIQSTYYGQANAQTATSDIQIISYDKRSVTAPQLVSKLQKKFDTDFTGAKVSVGQIDVGPPSAAFTVQIDASNRPAALKAANDIAAYMQHVTLTRISGKKAHFTNITPPNADVYTSDNGKSNVGVTANFDGTDTTTLVNLGQDAVKKEFTAAKLKTYGLPSNAVSFNIGQESDNQNSFKDLALAFPFLLLAIYVVLAIEFRSFLQPLLIFMAIPFSIFGVVAGLFITNNPISFFSMLGFFALIGLSIKNTILLTDFANQARRAGANPVDAAVAALEERFRPLIATSLMAVLSLVPLAVTSPFWQGLAAVLIFGLLSSTILVITVFPYYYLGAEFLRAHLGPRHLYRKLRGVKKTA